MYIMCAIDITNNSFAAIVNSKELGEMDMQENTTPAHHGKTKKKESAKKKERARKRTSSVLDSTNGETCLVI